jgi:2-hydroxy-3-keto-5-methylthiopentenyl-1-phosphate phosphatase
VRLVLDWDGTVTEVDSLHLVLEQFGDPDVYRDSERALGRRLTLHEVIAVEFESVSAPVDEVVEWLLRVVRIREGFRELVAARRPTVISAGFHELIEPVLAREGVEVELLANRLDPRPDGWRVLWRDEASCAVCGEPCKRGALADGGPYVYIGDGYSDRCAALGAERVFARDGLARYLTEAGVPFQPFDDLHDIAAELAH